MQTITIKKNDAGQRLDKFLTKAVKGLPQSMMYKLIRTKKIKLNRKRKIRRAAKLAAKAAEAKKEAEE